MMELNELQNYEEMKDKLIVRLMNYENYEETLKKNYFMKIGDIAAAICIADKIPRISLIKRSLINILIQLDPSQRYS